MQLTPDVRNAKLLCLVRAEGYPDLNALLQDVVADSVCPAICTEIGCSYTCETEPDQDQGWCEACGKTTVPSALILAGLI
jgi:hypothetical protein